MASFSYEIVTKDGKRKKGSIEADNIDKARNSNKSEASMVI